MGKALISVWVYRAKVGESLVINMPMIYSATRALARLQQGHAMIVDSGNYLAQVVGMPEIIERVRRFNRFYTEQIGVLTDHLLDSDYTLTEVRVLYEIDHHDGATAAQIAQDLGVDRGYLSRVLQRLQREGLVRRTTAPHDGRARLLALTARGRRLFRGLDTRADRQIEGLLRHTSAADRDRLTSAMRTIESVLADPAIVHESNVVLREPRAGDLGWVVHRHGALYWQEYRYDERFEALVATIVGDFVAHRDPARERCWIADLDGEIAGSVFLVRHSGRVGKLRLLYVEPWARGHGIGDRLVGACVAFAREAGYRKVTLWTQSELLAARRLYQRAGFVRVREEPNPSFGRGDLVSETWELTL
jgi:DNA-binding MarR family transcriptional regulator/GNAT superfamily N-acetyltransferase